MKILEITCNSKDKEDILIALDKKERKILYDVLKVASETNKRKTSYKKMFDYIHKYMPI